MSNSSKLYNTLKTIDDGRKDCITALNAAGANLPDTANFASIAANIEANVNVDPLPYPMPGVPMKPEDDPEMPEPFPEDYPDFEKILKSKKEIEVDGLSYYPGTIVVFQTDLPTTELFVKKGSQEEKEMVELGNDKMQIGMCYPYFYAKQTKPYYNTCKYVETSDGSTYTFATTRPDDSDITKTETEAKDMSYIHTWDIDKDIVLNDGSRLKYIIIYYMYAGALDSFGKPNTGTSYTYAGSQQNYGVDVVEIISCGWHALYHTQSYHDIFSTICTKKPYKRLIYIAPFTKNAYWGSKTTKYGLYSTKQNKMEQLVIKESEDFPISLYYQYSSNTPVGPRFYSPYLKALYIFNKVSDVYLNDESGYEQNIGSKFSLSLIYVRVNFGSHFILPRVKYFYVTPDKQIDVTLKSIRLPLLRDTNIYDAIKNVNVSSYNRFFFGYHNKNLILNNLETLGGSFSTSEGVFSSTRTTNLTLPKLKQLSVALMGTTSTYDLRNNDINICNLPSLEIIDKEQTLSARCLLLPKLQDVSNLSVSYLCEYLDISGCKTGTLNLSSKDRLTYIKFPEVITLTNVNIYNCYNLSHDFLIDMFNRLMTVEDGLTHTVTLGYLKYLCTDEELAIVTNKGWTLK